MKWSFDWFVVSWSLVSTHHLAEKQLIPHGFAMGWTQLGGPASVCFTGVTHGQI